MPIANTNTQTKFKSNPGERVITQRLHGSFESAAVENNAGEKHGVLSSSYDTRLL